MIRPLALAAALLGLLALLALGGCAFNHGVTLNNPPPAAKTAFLKGRAFTVGKVTVAPDARPVHETVYHCLPDPMYAKMMKYNLELAFQRAGLTQGKGPAVPVSITITQRVFHSNLLIHSSNMEAMLSFGTFSILAHAQGVGSPLWENKGQRWTRQQRIIPALAAIIATGIKSIQQGQTFNSKLQSPLVGFYFGPGSHPKTHAFNLPYPMTVKEYEQITGKSAAQLAAICKARIAGK
ncbi:hypothetical protein BI364_07165 [Acidihalobacter yilgarnensis]|uniref:Lipoprotein n=1 Tax=Acidihalobacter yilgarnensis TaxID=2819280 RepID=A0A1D8IMS3_9GAMM|nr:hypothetical protein [Acidihalobacter yilgarnensis]AOU97772.1 hypothetical protein BI364_07165 [Acidihalobacter yilgarnensis]